MPAGRARWLGDALGCGRGLAMGKRAVSGQGAAKANKELSVLLVDQHVLTRIGARAVLEAQKDIRVVGECAAADEALEMARALRPTVAIVDLLTGPSSGFGLIRELRQHAAETNTLACTNPLPAATIQHLLSIGACGYLSKFEPPGHLIDAVRSVAMRKVYVDAAAAGAVIGGLIQRRRARGAATGAAADAEAAIVRLTPAELEVFHMIGSGRSTRAIAAALHRSIKTIETYRCRIRAKLGLPDAAMLGQMAWQFVHSFHPRGAGAGVGIEPLSH